MNECTVSANFCLVSNHTIESEVLLSVSFLILPVALSDKSGYPCPEFKEGLCQLIIAIFLDISNDLH